MEAIETPRLLLREFTLDDAPAFLVLNSNPEVLRYTGDPGVFTLDAARQALRDRPMADYQKHGYGRLACILKQPVEKGDWLRANPAKEKNTRNLSEVPVPFFNGQATGPLIGFAGLKWLDDLGDVDLGYRFLPAWWGQGLATEASQAALADGFARLKLPHVLGLVDPTHARSIRVLEKLGFQDTGMVEYRGVRVGRYLLGREEAGRGWKADAKRD